MTDLRVRETVAAPAVPPVAGGLRGLAPVGVLATVILLVPLLVSNEYYLDIIVSVLVLACAGAAWNLLGGYAGQLSLGHSMFFGIGAYASVQLFVRFGISPWLGALAGGAAAAALGVAIGGLTLRLRGPFFTLATIAFGQILFILARESGELTGGATGLSVPYRPGLTTMVFDDRGAYVWLVGGLLVAIYGGTKLFERHRLGFRAVAVRENLDAAEALGVNTVAVKLTMTALSAFATAITGAFATYYLGFVDPECGLGLNLAIQIVLIAIIGGMGTAFGPIAGAVLVQLLDSSLNSWLGGTGGGGLYLVIYGALLIVVVLFVPRGLVVTIGDVIRRRWRPVAGGGRRA